MKRTSRNRFRRSRSKLLIRSSLALPATVALGAASTAFADVRYVRTSASGLMDGSSWANSYTIDDALIELNGGKSGVTVILVAQGTYKPASASAPFPIANPCLIKGGYKGTEPNPDTEGFVTTLSGDLTGNDDGTLGAMSENAFHVIDIAYSADEVTIENVTIRGGNAINESSSFNRQGGGIRSRADLIVLQCIFDSNAAEDGGAIWTLQDRRLEVRRSEFLTNGPPPPTSGAHWPAVGGAIESAGELVVVRSKFIGNRVGDGGNGGAIAALRVDADFQVTNCQFIGNIAGRTGISSTSAGGAVFSLRDAEITGCLFADNEVRGGSSSHGGAIATEQHSSPNSVTLRLCTLADNSSAGVAGGVLTEAAIVYDSIAWGNTAGSGSTFQKQITASSSTTIEYSCVQGLNLTTFPTGNINTDPDFVGSGDYHLDPISDAIDTGPNSLVPNDVTDVDENPGTNGKLPEDLDRHFRISRCTVDMGAFEFGTQCVGDLNDDGIVDGDDLGALLGEWGPCSGCLSDFDCSGVVDGDDLGTLLGNWGTCPEEVGGGSMMMFGEGESPITPQAMADEFGFDSVEEFADWLAGLDFSTMSGLLEGLFGG